MFAEVVDALLLQFGLVSPEGVVVREPVSSNRRRQTLLTKVLLGESKHERQLNTFDGPSLAEANI